MPDSFTSTENRIIVRQVLKLVFKNCFRGRCSYSFLETFFYQITLDHRIGRRKLALSFYCRTYSVILQTSCSLSAELPRETQKKTFFLLERELCSEGNIKLICTTVGLNSKCVTASATGTSLSLHCDIRRSA